MLKKIGLAALLACCLPFGQAYSKPSLMQRLERLERLAESQGQGSSAVTELVERVEVLEGEVRRLRGRLEVQAHTLEEMENRQRDLYLDVDRRLSEMSGAPRRSAVEPSQEPQVQAPGETPEQPGADEAAAALAPEPVPVAELPPGDPRQEQARYEEAFDLLKDGRYDEATQGFRTFLAQYPGSRYADNAQYWLGEASYVKRDFDTALVELGRVVSNYPSSPEVADALLKIGFVYYETQRWDEARKALERVDQAYHNATAARLARQRLQQMSREGH